MNSCELFLLLKKDVDNITRKHPVVKPKSFTSEALFGVSAVALSLLFISIHNAWDSIVYLAFYSKQKTIVSDVD